MVIRRPLALYANDLAGVHDNRQNNLLNLALELEMVVERRQFGFRRTLAISSDQLSPNFLAGDQLDVTTQLFGVLLGISGP